MSDAVFGNFEWDTVKSEANVLKHGVTFEAATVALMDPNNVLVRLTTVTASSARSSSEWP